MPIRSFACADTQQFFDGSKIKQFEPFESVAMRKLAMLDAAKTLGELRIPPANRLEALKGNRARQHSIRINDQFRICFTWTEAGPAWVEICDYHR